MPSINDNVVLKANEVIAKAEQIRVLADAIASQPTIARLDTIISLLEAGNDMAQLVGAAFPDFPTLGNPFWKEGFSQWQTWNGSIWFDTPERIPLFPYVDLPYSGGVPATFGVAPSYAGETFVIIGAWILYHVQTTNNASNYWTFGVDVIGTAATVLMNTSVKSAATWYNEYLPINLQRSGAINLQVTGKTGTPGPLYAYAQPIVGRIRT